MNAMRCRPLIRCIAAGALAVAMSAHALTLHVAPNGSDQADGLSALVVGNSGPMASLQAALVRMGERAGQPGDTDSADRILLAPGTYVLPATAVIDARARGDSTKPLVVSALEPGTAILSGGTVLPPFRPDGPLWRTQAPTGGFADLWVDGRRAVLARSPNGGAWFQGGSNTSRPVREKNPLAVTQPATIDNTRRLVLAPDASNLLRGLLTRPGASLEGMHLVAMHSWAGSRQQVVAFDPKTGVLTVAPNGRWPFLLFDRDQRYAFENHPALLDEPGEWWASAEGAVRYRPRPADATGPSVAVVPRLETLLTVAGTAERPLRSVVLRGLRFRHAAAATTPSVDGQAATAAPSAVVADYVQGLEIDQCAFEQLGGHALWLRDGVTDSRVRRSHFHDLGGGGVRIGDTRRPGSDGERTARISVENNLIENGGINFPSAVGVWIGQAGGNRIAHNEIRDFNYSGISIGWSWNFDATDATRNMVEYNHLHDIGRGVLSDLGGIYTLGVSDGTTIRRNLIERVVSARQTGGSTGFGIYLDAGSSGIVVEDNVAIGSTGGGFHLHWGRDNTVRNNVFADGKLAQAKRVRSGPDAGLRFERNVLAGASAAVYQGEWSDNDVRTERNILFSAEGSFRLRDRDLRTLQSTGHEKDSVDSNPNLDCDRNGCTVDGSVASRTGFKPISLKGVGIQDRGAVLPR